MKYNRWFICFASFVVQFLVFGIQNSYGILFVSLKAEFKSSQIQTAWIGTLSFTLMFFLGPLMTISCARFGCCYLASAGSVLVSAGLFCSSYVTDMKLLYVSYGLGLGIGTSMCFYSSLGILNIHFNDRLSLAYGISMSGAGFGVPVIAKMSNYFISTAGWRKSVQIMSASGSIIFCCSMIFFRKNEEPSIKKSTASLIVQQKYSKPWYKHLVVYLSQFWKMLLDYEMFVGNKPLCVWTLSVSLILSGYLVPFIYLIRIADDIGVPGSQSALLIGYLAISQAVSKVIFGQFGDMGATSRIRILQTFVLINAVNVTLCPLAFNYEFLVVFVVVFGVCDGCLAVMFSMGTHFIVGDKNMTRAFGNVCCIIAVVQAIGTPLAGLTYDVFGQYNIAFFISGGLSTLGVCIAFLVPIPLLERKVIQSKSSSTTGCKTIGPQSKLLKDYKRETENIFVKTTLSPCSSNNESHMASCACTSKEWNVHGLVRETIV